MLRMKRFQLAGPLVIVLAARLQVKLPSVAADGHLHDFGGALVNCGNANVTADFLYQVFVRVAVASESLNAGVGSLVSSFGRHVLRDGAFGIQTAFSGIGAFGRLLDISAGCFQSRHVWHDQLVRVTLLLRERRSGLNALGGIGNRPIERCPSPTKTEGCHHQAGVTEDGLGLKQALSFYAADQPLSIYVNVTEGEGRRIAEADAVLVFGFIVRKALRALFDNEPTRTTRRIRQDRVR